ncbi:MAG: hypothetical protein OHK006_12800 [Thermodesulfovibrionales bacterium]
MLPPNQIRARLIERGITLTEVARQLRVSRVTVSVVVGSFGTSRRIRAHIAKLLGLEYEQVWGRDGHRRAA